MAIQFIDPKKVEYMQAYVNDTIKYQRACAELWKFWVRPVLAKHDGKKMTKRITTDFEKSLKVNSDKFHGYFDTNYGMYHFKIMGDVLGVDFRNKYSFSVHLGYHSQGDVLNLAWVEEHNVFYVQNAAKYADQLEKNKAAIPGLVSEWNECLEKMKKINKLAEACGLGYKLDIKEN